MHSDNIQHIPKLDHLRGFAALLVLAFHVFHYFFYHWASMPSAWYLGLVIEGHVGIGLFFVLSGFIFTHIASNSETLNYFQFIRNRFLRIFPLFLLVFFVAISINRNNFSPGDIFYIFFSNLGNAPTSNYFITGASWTISIEFIFYFAFPFLYAASRGKPYSKIIGLIIILVLFKLAAFHLTQNFKQVMYSTLLGRFDQFLFGMLSAFLFNAYKNRLNQSLTVLIFSAALVVLSVGLMARFFSYHSANQADLFWVFWPSIEALVWSQFILVYLLTKQQLYKLISNAFSYVGKVSYSLYLLHGLVIFLWSKYIGALRLFNELWADFLFTFLVIGFFSLIISGISYRSIEKPFLQLRKKYTSGDRVT